MQNKDYYIVIEWTRFAFFGVMSFRPSEVINLGGWVARMLKVQLPADKAGECLNTCAETTVVLGNIVKAAGRLHTTFFVVCKYTQIVAFISPLQGQIGWVPMELIL